MSASAWETLSNQAVAGCGVIYFLALLATLVHGSAQRRLPIAERSLVTAGVGGPGAVAPSGQDEAELTGRSALAGRIGVALTAVALAVHAVALASRGLAADPNRVPWGNMYEFTLSGTFMVVAVYLALRGRFHWDWLAPIVLTLVLGLLMVAVLVLYAPVTPLNEALNSTWLVIHVISAIISTGAFVVGGICAALYLLRERAERRGSVGGYLARVPDLVTLDRIGYRVHAFGFPVWTFAVLITGPIWAHQAWASYWSWDPKEVWAFITWVVYAGYLHARATAGWRGRKAATLALVGLATLLFNFVGINYFSTTSQHSYAGLGEQRVVSVGSATGL